MRLKPEQLGGLGFAEGEAVPEWRPQQIDAPSVSLTIRSMSGAKASGSTAWGHSAGMCDSCRQPTSRAFNARFVPVKSLNDY